MLDDFEYIISWKGIWNLDCTNLAIFLIKRCKKICNNLFYASNQFFGTLDCLLSVNELYIIHSNPLRNQIPVRAALEGVGRNLQDHPIIRDFIFIVDKGTTADNSPGNLSLQLIKDYADTLEGIPSVQSFKPGFHWGNISATCGMQHCWKG